MKESLNNLFIDLRVFVFSIVHVIKTWWHRKTLSLLEQNANDYAAKWFEVEVFAKQPVYQRIKTMIWGLGWDFCQYKTGEEIAGLAIALQLTSSNVEHQTRKYAQVIQLLKERECVQKCAYYFEDVLDSHTYNVNVKFWIESGVIRALKTLWHRRSIRALEGSANVIMMEYLIAIDAASENVGRESMRYIIRSNWTSLRGIIVSLGHHVMNYRPETLAKYARELNYTLYHDGEDSNNPIVRLSFPITQITSGAIDIALITRISSGDLRKAKNGNLY